MRTPDPDRSDRAREAGYNFGYKVVGPAILALAFLALVGGALWLFSVVA